MISYSDGNTDELASVPEQACCPLVFARGGEVGRDMRFRFMPFSVGSNGKQSFTSMTAAMMMLNSAEFELGPESSQ